MEDALRSGRQSLYDEFLSSRHDLTNRQRDAIMVGLDMKRLIEAHKLGDDDILSHIYGAMRLSYLQEEMKKSEPRQ